MRRLVLLALLTLLLSDAPGFVPAVDKTKAPVRLAPGEGLKHVA